MRQKNEYDRKEKEKEEEKKRNESLVSDIVGEKAYLFPNM